MMKKSIKFFLIVSIIIPLTLSGLEAQNIKLKKWAFGSGGMVAQVNSENHKMSGLIGQLAIEKIVLPRGSQDVNEFDIDVYQGFWTPTGVTGTPVKPIPVYKTSLMNYPNPVRSQTTFSYTLPGASYVTLSIYDVSGKRVNVLINDVMQSEGEHHIDWNVVDFAGQILGSGSYLYELSVRPAQVAGGGFQPYNIRNIAVVVK